MTIARDGEQRSIRFFFALSVLIGASVFSAHAATVSALPVADPWEADIAAFEAGDRAHPPVACGVVFIGSSSIRKLESMGADFPDANALNRGFGGSRIADATRYVPRIVTPYRPRLVVLYAGDNDLAEGATAAQVLADFRAFVGAVRAAAPLPPIAFVSIKPRPSRLALIDTMRQANALVRAYARQQQQVRYIDVFTPMLDAGGKPREALFGADGLHMNAAGYALWTHIFAPYILAMKPAH